jgi:hypothetical protein
VNGTAPNPTNPVELLSQLNSETVRARLDQINAERQGLLVLLRTIKARERAAARRKAVRSA